MKVTKVPGLGRFGVYIDDVDLNTISDEEWMEIGKIHLESLVTIIRGNNIDHKTYYDLILKFGNPRWLRPLQLYRKYGKPVKEIFLKRLLDKEDRSDMLNDKRWVVDRKCPGMLRVTPKRDDKGRCIGIFGDNELYWHSNECGSPSFTPAVSLMGVQDMVGSTTGFCTTADWYEKQSDSFKSELNEMVVVHNFRTNPREYDDKNRLYMESSLSYDEVQNHYYENNQCPENNSRLPLVIKSPGGIKGLHYTPWTMDYIEGMSREESTKLLTQISAEIFTEEYIYDHKYQDDNDILLFDNSITLHNRSAEGEISPNRLGYRIQFDYDRLLGGEYQPFFQEEFIEKRVSDIKELHFAMA